MTITAAVPRPVCACTSPSKSISTVSHTDLGISGVDEPPGITARRLSQPPVTPPEAPVSPQKDGQGWGRHTCPVLSPVLSAPTPTPRPFQPLFFKDTLPRPPVWPPASPACFSISSFNGTDISSSTVQGWLTWPEMLNSLVPELRSRPKLANQAPPRRQMVGDTDTVSTLATVVGQPNTPVGKWDKRLVAARGEDRFPGNGICPGVLLLWQRVPSPPLYHSSPVDPKFRQELQHLVHHSVLRSQRAGGDFGVSCGG